jgi:asparagine synthase (glutamine-hydrolysing)
MRRFSNPQQVIYEGLALIRHMGPRWIAKRVYQTTLHKSGTLKRRSPLEQWNSRPLADYLRNGISSEPVAYVRWRETGAGRFFFDELPQPDLLSSVSRRKAVVEAERLLMGQWTYFGVHPVKVGLPPDWYSNPLTGESAPADRHWADIPDFAFGDIKLVWEASRFTPVFVLVRAYAHTKDDRYAEAFWALVKDWAERNPPQCGPNWKCGQEAAFRVMAWCFGLYGFLASQQTTPERVAMLSRMIAVTAQRIEGNIGYALSQNNNHGISEAVGLFTVGTLFPEFHRAQSWRNKGRMLLESQATRQIYADGAYVQHSMNYHRVMLHDYLWALRLAERNGEPFSHQLYGQLLRSSEFLDNMTDANSGQTPNQGNNDGTLVLPLSDCDYRDFRPTLQALRYLCTRRRQFAEGLWDEMMVWLFGPESLDAPMAPTLRPSCQASHSGNYVLRGPESWAMIRCTEYRDRPAHADQLHFDLWWRGLNITLDSGTYLYNAAAPWNVAFSGTAAHNTVMIDGRDQMRRFSRFLWLDWARGSNVRHNSEGDSESWQGEHDGYQRLNVIHRRKIERYGDRWNVIDDILGHGNHKVSLRWLLPDLPVSTDAQCGLVRLETTQGPVIVTDTSSTAADFTLVRGGQRIAGKGSHSEDITRGWVSYTYADKEPALSLGLDVETSLPVRFETRFEFGMHDCDLHQPQMRIGEV